MKSTAQYLDEVKSHLELESDYALAKTLDITRASISSYRTGRTFPDNLACARIALALGVDPMEVIAAVNYQKSADDSARKLWESIWGKAAGAIALSLLVFMAGLSVAPSTKAAEYGDNTAKSGKAAFTLSYVK